jgi:hypothetical protein
MPTIAFIPGWAEGSWHSKLLEQKLAEVGIYKKQDLKNADILFCHSTGCYLIPKDAHAKLIILVGLPYWPDRSLIYAGLKKFAEDFKNTKKDMGLMWWLNKTTHNVGYIIQYPKDTLLVATKHKPENLPDSAKHKVLLVRNKQDNFCHPKINKILKKASGYKFIELPAGHDDCWSAKQSYVDLIKSSEDFI